MTAQLGSLLEAASQLRRATGCSASAATASVAVSLDTDGYLAGHPLVARAEGLPGLEGVAIPPFADRPDLLGAIFEQLLGWEHRRRTGSHFTPPDLADRLVGLTLEAWQDSISVCDPAAGSGAFLLAAARALEGRGIGRAEIVSSKLFGCDLSAEALEVADAALTLWSGGHRPEGRLICGDGFGIEAVDESFDVIIGNPPFLSQLASATSRSRPEATALRRRFGHAATGYVDSAALFLLASLDLVASPGRVLMVQPHSTLAAADAEAVRRALRDRADLVAVWLGGRDDFHAEVEVCALLFEVGSAHPPATVKVVAGNALDVVASHESVVLEDRPTWSVLLASATGVPELELDGDATLAALCTATAGFRDQFYGLAEFTHEGADDHGARLTTVGMLDPARSRWGTAGFRFNKQVWHRPFVDVQALSSENPNLATWVADRLKPKICVATQTRVIEAAVDLSGDWVPATPVVSVHADPADLWRVAAVLLAPPVTVWAMHAHAGAALSSDALRLSARQVLAVPLPSDVAAWEAGAACVRAASVAATEGDVSEWKSQILGVGEQMSLAYGISDERPFFWWKERLPGWR